MDSKHSRLTNRIFLIIVLFFLIGLFGCSPSSEGNDNASSPNNPIGENEPVTITFSSDESISNTIEPLVETFNEENPGIIVQYVPISIEETNTIISIEDRLLMLASSADTTLTSARSAYAGRYFLDLQPLIDADPDFDSTDFWGDTLSGMEDTQGRITGLPMTLFLQGIFYNKATFDEAGLAYPQPGWTWEDFRSAAATLANTTEGYGFIDRESPSILQPLIGYQLALNDGEINAEAMNAALEWYIQMASEDQILGMRSTDGLWVSQFDSDTPPAMWSGSLFELALGYVTGEPEATALKTLFSDSAYGFVPFPIDAKGENINTTPISALYGAISIATEHPQESWQWLNYLCTSLSGRNMRIT